jgi:hypothetical protein
VPAPQYQITSGRRARSYRLENGARRFGPWRVEMEVQLSPLSITSDTLVFYLYKEDGDGAVERAGAMLENLYRRAKSVPDGYPKPTGLGTAKTITDQEFRLTWLQAEKERSRLYKNGDKSDPVAFHVYPQSRTIITPR